MGGVGGFGRGLGGIWGELEDLVEGLEGCGRPP